jgi:hypothetical protein
VQACTIAGYLAVKRLAEFQLLSPLWHRRWRGDAAPRGLARRYCGQYSGQYSGQRIMGALFLRRDRGVEPRHGLWPVGGGWVFDTFNGQAWLYIRSLSLGRGAAAMALAFPAAVRSPDDPAPRER